MRMPLMLPSARLIALALALATVALTSCALHVKTAKQPFLQTGSPLSALKRLKVCVAQFEDARGVAPDHVGQIGVREMKLDKPVAAMIQDSVRREFERNGHIGVEPGRAQEADIVVTGTVYRYSLDQQVGYVSVKVMGNVGVKVSIKSASRPTEVFVKKYDGTYYTSGMGISNGKAIKVLNEARLNMLKEFTGDQEFLDFLKRTGSGLAGK